MISILSKSVIFEKMYVLHASLSFPSSIQLHLSPPPTGWPSLVISQVFIKGPCVPHMGWELEQT